MIPAEAFRNTNFEALEAVSACLKTQWLNL